MVAFKCKLCGGTLIPNPDGQTGKCEYCKNILTLPKEKDEKLQNILNRANDFRMVCDFDRAIYEYEKALEIAEDEPEAHWGLMLSRYGVEFVKDPQSFTFKPTLHRISSISVLEDPDYLAAVKYASPANAYTYKEDAQAIESAMRKLLQISASEEPYDIFISYKKEENGIRTPDSYFAHDLYNKLTGAGYKVFFAQETLKQAAGEEFEPKIYAAIISAKVMIVIGTKEEYFNAVWVKNEWSRFSELIEHGEDKTIIPVFDNFDIGKLPNRLSKYQALQKSDLDFLNVLMQTVEKRVDNRKTKVSFDKDVSTEKVALERGFLALEDGQFSNADVFFEKALNANPHSSEAYFGKLMVELKARKQEDIVLSDRPLNTYNNFVKAVRFADQGSKAQLFQYEETVQYNIDQAKCEQLVQSLAAEKQPERAIDLLSELILLNEQMTGRKNEKYSALIQQSEAVILQTNKNLKAYSENLINQNNNLSVELKQLTDQKQQFEENLNRINQEFTDIEKTKKSILFAIFGDLDRPILSLVLSGLFGPALGIFSIWGFFADFGNWQPIHFIFLAVSLIGSIVFFSLVYLAIKDPSRRKYKAEIAMGPVTKNIQELNARITYVNKMIDVNQSVIQRIRQLFPNETA